MSTITRMWHNYSPRLNGMFCNSCSGSVDIRDNGVGSGVGSGGAPCGRRRGQCGECRGGLGGGGTCGGDVAGGGEGGG